MTLRWANARLAQRSSGTAVRRDAFEAVGGFEERLSLFSEETDLCRRIHDAGRQARVEPETTVVHHASKAGDDRDSHGGPPVGAPRLLDDRDLEDTETPVPPGERRR